MPRHLDRIKRFQMIPVTFLSLRLTGGAKLAATIEQLCTHFAHSLECVRMDFAGKPAFGMTAAAYLRLVSFSARHMLPDDELINLVHKAPRLRELTAGNLSVLSPDVVASLDHLFRVPITLIEGCTTADDLHQRRQGDPAIVKEEEWKERYASATHLYACGLAYVRKPLVRQFTPAPLGVRLTVTSDLISMLDHLVRGTEPFLSNRRWRIGDVSVEDVRRLQTHFPNLTLLKLMNIRSGVLPSLHACSRLQVVHLHLLGFYSPAAGGRMREDPLVTLLEAHVWLIEMLAFLSHLRQLVLMTLI